MVARGANFKQVELNVVGSSIFGRYGKISTERTYNMFESDSFLVSYAGYQIAIPYNLFLGTPASEGRAVFTSTKLNRIVIVIDANVFLVNIDWSQTNESVIFQSIIKIGTLQTTKGVVYVTENNAPQILISDGELLYLYDPAANPTFSIPTSDGTNPIDFVPGYITFHDEFFICTPKIDIFEGGATNTWRLSAQNNGALWGNASANIGFLETKPDNTQAVVRFPSKGNMIFVMGKIVTEAWFDTGAQLFPYQRNNQFNIDYGCVSPATVAYMDEYVVWLAQNEKSGPIIMYSDGGMPKKITTDGIDYLFAQFQNPQDSQGFLYRQDGHLFYHINFYSDNFSLFYDFNNGKFYNASDENLDFFIAAEVCFFDNQYYFVSQNTGNLYTFDTIFTTYQDTDELGNIVVNEIPRIRTCKNIRQASQDYFIANDIGFTIETGETNYQQEYVSPIYLTTQDGKQLITQGNYIFLMTQDGNFLQTQDNQYLVSQQTDSTDYFNLIANQSQYAYITPRVDMSLSYDGGASFGNAVPYVLNAIGQRKNKLIWWQCGMTNDLVAQFRFNGIGRFVVTNGVCNVRS